MPFKVFGENNQIKIGVEYKGEQKVLLPEEVTAAVLSKMQKTAETYVGEKVSDVVITVPAHFDIDQRDATMKAAEIAGLNVIRLLNEPAAAAIAYIHKLTDGARVSKTVLVYDLGGGTFDVSILRVKDNIFTVRAVKGDTFGGEDFDNLMMNYLAETFKQASGEDITTNKETMCHLRANCERIKRILSTLKTASFYLEGTTFVGSITRDQFENLCDDLFKKSIRLISEVLEELNMTKEEIDDVILVGGSTRIPRIQELIQNFFNGKQLHKSINFDERVAYGAAVLSALLQTNQLETKEESSLESSFSNLRLTDVCPISLGTGVWGGGYVVMIPRNTHIPVTRSETFVYNNNHTCAKITVYQGENPVACENHHLGEFVLDGLPPALGNQNMYVEFTLDENGILHVSSIEPRSGTSKKITIVKKERLSYGNVKRAHEDTQCKKEKHIKTENI